jgi:trimethylguanosine synthase
VEAAEEPHEKAVEARAANAPDDAAAALAGKYWRHRYNLFSLYDRGLRRQVLAPRRPSQAARAAPRDLVTDAFADCGGNPIQFAARHAMLLSPPLVQRSLCPCARGFDSAAAASRAGVATSSQWRPTRERWS